MPKRGARKASESSDSSPDSRASDSERGSASDGDDGEDGHGPVSRRGGASGSDGESNYDSEGEGERDEEVVETVGEVVDDGEEEAAPLSSVAPASVEPAALSRSDPLQAYLREIQRYPLLTPEEEQTLTRKYTESQDVRTAARLVTANLRLVVKLAYEYRRAYKNIMDLIQEGNIGLMQAVKRYDPYRGVKLSSYAAWWIRAYMLRFILNNWRLVKLGTTQAQRKLFFNLNKEKAKLAAMGIDPTPEAIAARLDVDKDEVVEMDRRLASSEASLDAPVGDAEGRSVSRVDLMPSATSGPDSLLERQEMDELVSQRLRAFRATLKGKDVVIFDKRMAAEDPLTLQELGDEFGVSRERVRQLEARLHHKLRDYLKSELGDAVTTR
ncbi:MAG: RNA polymerase factor sigma-32 [Polyangiaceae bacterium]